MDRESAMPVAGQEGMRSAYRLRLPELRRAPGWAVLDDHAVRVRAVQIVQACLPAKPATPPPASPDDTPPYPPDPSVPSGPGAARSVVAHPPQPVVSQGGEGRPESISSKRSLARAGGSSRLAWLGVPVWALLAGLTLIAPWLIWAPLVGGLLLGILLLQAGLLKRWLANRTAQSAAEESPDAGRDLPETKTPFAPARSGATVVEPVQSVRPPGLRMSHSGWLLAAALALVGIQVAMVLATLQIRRTVPAMQADADRPSTIRRGASGEDPDGEPAGALPPLPLPASPKTSRATTGEAADVGRREER